jgi:hypothetical protein
MLPHDFVYLKNSCLCLKAQIKHHLTLKSSPYPLPMSLPGVFFATFRTFCSDLGCSEEDLCTHEEA